MTVYKKIGSMVLAALVIFAGGCASNGGAAVQQDFNAQYVLEAPDKTKDELYAAVHEWAAENFRSSKQVIEFSDKSTGMIIVKYVSRYVGFFSSSEIAQMLVIAVKDGKARVVFKTPAKRTVVGGDDGLGSQRAALSEKDMLRIQGARDRIIGSLTAVLNRQKVEW